MNQLGCGRVGDEAGGLADEGRAEAGVDLARVEVGVLDELLDGGGVGHGGGGLDDSVACMVKGGEIGDFGGGWLEHPRQWLGTQWSGLFLGVPGCPEPPGAP